jgi:hypothetical protein
MKTRRPIDALTPEERHGAYLAKQCRRCFTCNAEGPPVAVGVFNHPSNPRTFIYPMCKACHADFTDPAQRQAFAEAVHRRFVKLGEVKA